MYAWVRWAQEPQKAVSDQGTEFRAAFADYLSKIGISLRLAPTEAPWQNALPDRHGGVVGEIVRMLVEEFPLEGQEDMELACQAATLAKN